MSAGLYHYTYGHKLEGIRASGALLPTGASIPRHERKALWFSRNAQFEPTAFKLAVRDGRVLRLGFHELADLFGAYRFVLVNDSGLTLFRWPGARKRLGILPDAGQRMEAIGFDVGANPADWVATVHPVGLDRLELERFDSASGLWTAQSWEELPALGSAEVA